MERITSGVQFASSLRPELLNGWHEGFFVIIDASTSEPIVEEPCVWQFYAQANGLAALRFGRDIFATIPGNTYRYFNVSIHVTDSKRQPVMAISTGVRVNEGTQLHFKVEEEAS